jgi:hypothetical protein
MYIHIWGVSHKERLLCHPFNAGCLPLKYSGNPGVFLDDFENIQSKYFD